MQVLALAGHAFNGSLPLSWTGLQQLRVLDVSHNQISGTLPQPYVSMQQLTILKVNDNKLMHVSNGMPELFESLVGNGFKLQCLCVANNSEVLLSEEGKARLMLNAQKSSPAVQLAVDAPDNSQCCMPDMVPPMIAAPQPTYLIA
jgi:Leucine-rich repeat (LRR) protein